MTWGCLDSVQAVCRDLGPFDFVIASDCFYETHLFEDVLFTVRCIFDDFVQRDSNCSSDDNERKKYSESEKQCTFVFSYESRSANRSIHYGLMKFGMQAALLSNASTDDSENDPTTIELYSVKPVAQVFKAP